MSVSNNTIAHCINEQFEFNYHSNTLFNIIDSNGHSFPHWKKSNKNKSQHINTEKDQIILITKELDNMSKSNICHIDKYQQSALHLAVSQPIMSFNIINVLINCNPSMVKIKNCHGNLAMHIAIFCPAHFQQHSSVDYKVIQLLYEMYPESVYVKNVFEQSPIQIAVRKNKASVIKFFLNLDAKAVYENLKIEWNWLLNEKCNRHNMNTPLHLRLCSNAILEEIIMLINEHPQYVLKVNINGRNPYDIAIIHYHPDESSRCVVLHTILRTMKNVCKLQQINNWNNFKLSHHYKELMYYNWNSRKQAIMFAYKFKDGLYFEILKWVSLFF